MLDLREAIRVAAEVGYEAMEVGCFAPHLTLTMAETGGDEVRAWLGEADLAVSALSLDVSHTAADERSWRASIEETGRFIELCEKFGTRLMKIMPGQPGHAEATEQHWTRFRRAMATVVPVAEAAGVRLALETHLNHLSDSIDSTARCLECGNPEVLGVNLDFCNIRTCGESPLYALERFRDRIYLTHIKDSLFNRHSGEYVPMGEGKMDYPPIIARLREVGYDGYLSVECLYPWAKRGDPRAAIAHDLGVVRELMGDSSAART